MGYETKFRGQLKFTQELTAKQLAKLNSILGEDCRDHEEWDVPKLTYIDLKLNKDYSGIQWDGSEKTYEMTDLVNVVIREMRKEFPEFGLTGTLLAQGEEIGDRWEVVIGDDGFAKTVNL